MEKAAKLSPEVRERAVRMVQAGMGVGVFSPAVLRRELAEVLGVAKGEIREVRIVRRGLDARRGLGRGDGLERRSQFAFERDQ